MKIKFAYFFSCPGWHTFLFACLILLSCLNILVLGINFPQVSLFALLLHSIFYSFHIYVYTILSLASKLFKKAFSLMFFLFFTLGLTPQRGYRQDLTWDPALFLIFMICTVLCAPFIQNVYYSKHLKLVYFFSNILCFHFYSKQGELCIIRHIIKCNAY